MNEKLNGAVYLFIQHQSKMVGYYCITYRKLHYVFTHNFDSHDLAEKIVQEVKTLTDDDFETMKCSLDRVRTMEEYYALCKATGMPVRSTGFDGILNAACHPEDYELVKLSTTIPRANGNIEHLVILDLDWKVITEGKPVAMGGNMSVYSW